MGGGVEGVVVVIVLAMDRGGDDWLWRLTDMIDCIVMHATDRPAVVAIAKLDADPARCHINVQEESASSTPTPNAS